VTEGAIARRYLVSGFVQGVGFRYFVLRAALRLQVSGFVRNLSDGRVEACAAGTPGQLLAFRATLERGPVGVRVSGVQEEPAELDPGWGSDFLIADST